MSRARKWFIIALLAAVIIILFRMGAHIPGALVSLILLIASITDKWLTLKTYTQRKGQTSQGKQSMSVKEACDILDVAENASKAEIKKAYTEAMKRNHPDTGGSKYIATQINTAKDTLLKNK